MPKLVSVGIIPEIVNSIGEHVHNQWEMVYYTYGEGTIKIGETNVDFCVGKLICLPPFISHSEHSIGGYKNIHLVIENFDVPIDSIPFIYDNEDKDFFNILSQIYKLFHKKSNNWSNVAENLLNALYEYIISYNLNKKRSAFVERFENLLVVNISNCNFVIEEALKDIPLAPDYFRSIFKKETGKTPLNYLKMLRINYAKQMLQNVPNTNLKIYEIAKYSGYDDPYYFSRVFKKVTGKKPSEWVNYI